MTKKEMIKLIQKREAELFLRLKQSQVDEFPNPTLVQRARAEWIAIDQLMSTLNIKSDLELEEANEAGELILAKQLNKIQKYRI